MTTPVPAVLVSPAAGKTRPARLQSEGSIGSISSVRFSDLVGLEPEDSGVPSKERDSDVTPASTPPRSAVISNKKMGLQQTEVRMLLIIHLSKAVWLRRTERLPCCVRSWCRCLFSSRRRSRKPSRSRHVSRSRTTGSSFSR